MSSCSEILRNPPKGHHFCQLHTTGKALDRALRVYVMAGLQKKETVAIFSNADRLGMIRTCIADSGLDPEALEAAGKLSLHDGSKTLEAFLSTTDPDWTGFRRAIQNTLDALATRGDHSGGKVIRIYGDMVNELWRKKRTEDAVQLEKLWNEILQDGNAPLFCGYEFDGLDPAAYRNPVNKIGYVHAEVAATEEDELSVHALDRACLEIIGFSLSAITRSSIFRASKNEPSLPALQQIVVWLERNLPMHTAEVLERARTHYSDAGLKRAFSPGDMRCAANQPY